MTAAAMEPDAEQLEELRARRLLELAGDYVRRALDLPDQVAAVRTLLAEEMLENAMLRLDIRRLQGRVDALERQRGYRQVSADEITIRDVVDHERLTALAQDVAKLKKAAQQ